MRKLLLAVGLIFLLVLCCALCAGSIYYVSTYVASSNSDTNISFEYDSGNQFANDKILLLKINGTIIDTRDEVASLFATGYVYGYEVKQQLYKAADDTNIKAVMIEISSGGGTISGANAIVEGVDYYQEKTNQPVYAYVRGIAASGAYMVASSADYIIADAGSMTGSIGVIFGSPFKYYNNVLAEQSSSGDSVVTKNGIDTFYISSGEYKDIGSPYRRMTDEEYISLKSGIDEEYNNFVDLINKNRNIDTNTIKNKIKALIYSNNKAKELNLIDDIGSYDDSLKKLSEKAGTTDYQVIKTKSQDLFSSLFSSYISNKQMVNSPLLNKMLVIYGDPSQYLN
jgi:protease-4